jgi:MFS family permease
MKPDQAGQAQAEEPKSGLRHNTRWNRLWVSQGASLLGDYVFDTTMVLWVATVLAAHKSWAPIAVAGGMIAAAGPVFLVGPIAGVLADRWDRRRIMVFTDLARAAMISSLLVVPLAGGHWPVSVRLTLVYVVVALESAAAQLFNPARFGVIAAIVPAEDRPRAFGRASSTSSLIAVLGPPIAAPLLFGTGVEWALVIDACSFLVSCATVWSMQVPAHSRGPERRRPNFRAEFLEGIRFFMHNRILMILMTTTCVYMLGVGMFSSLNVFFLTENLHVSATWLGTLNAGMGIGSIIGGLLVGRLASRVGEARVFTLGLSTVGVLILVYSRLGSLPAALIVYGLVGVPLTMVGVVANPLVLRATPEHLLGRVNSVLNPSAYLSLMASTALAGFLAGTVLRNLHFTLAGMSFGSIDTIFGLGSVLMIMSGLLMVVPLSRQLAAEKTAVAEPAEPAEAAL